MQDLVEATGLGHRTFSNIYRSFAASIRSHRDVGCRCTIHLPILGRWFAGPELLQEILLTYKQLQAHFPGNSSGQSSARTESGPKRERVASESLT